MLKIPLLAQHPEIVHGGILRRASKEFLQFIARWKPIFYAMEHRKERHYRSLLARQKRQNKTVDGIAHLWAVGGCW